ncbi:MAG TPA: GAF domain-containing protein [Anaerolineales bacterium]|nr:GAF domain-containing protein [Anaerolineales bacterium]
MIDKARTNTQLDRVTDKGSAFSDKNISWFASRDSPKRLVFILIAGIFLSEVFAMVVLTWLPEMPYALVTLTDALIMAGLIYPLLYYLVFRPLLEHIAERKRSEQALIQTNELLERYFSSIDTLIAYMDREFNFIRVNDTYARSGGHSAEYFSGRNHFALYPHEENQAIFQRVVDTGEPFSVLEKPFEYPEYPERGVTYWDWSLQPVKGIDGAIEGVVLSLVDVTERKRAELQLERQNQELRTLSEAEHRQRELAEGLVQAVITLTSSLQLEDVLNSVLDQIRRAIPFRGADIILIEGKTFRVAGFCGFEDLPGGVAAMQRNYTLDDFPLFQQICATLQPVLVPDTREQADWRFVPGMEWVRSYMAAPLISNGQVSGVINLTSDQPGFFNPETVQRLMAFAAPASLALNNAQLYKAELTARQAAETLSAAARALTQTLDLDQVIGTLLEHIEVIIHPDTTGVALLEDETRLATRAARGYERLSDPDQILSLVVDINSSPFLQRLVSERKSLLVPEIAASLDWRVFPRLEPIRSWLVVPLIASDKVIGVVGLGKTETGYFTPEHVRWAEALVGQAAMAIQNAWLFEQVRASSERLQGLSHRLVEVQENERRYIARELHDEAGQALTTLMVGLQLIEKKAEQPVDVRAEVVEMGHVLETVIENLHRLAMDLRPVSLDYLGLEAALRQHVETMSEKLGLEIQFAMTEISGRLPPNIEIAFYRIAQEALNNVARHASATRVDVLITRRADCLVLIIEDDGVGFAPSEAAKGMRMGLNGMRERAEMLDGKLVVESIPGKGSTVLVEVPYGIPNTHR